MLSNNLHGAYYLAAFYVVMQLIAIVPAKWEMYIMTRLQKIWNKIRKGTTPVGVSLTLLFLLSALAILSLDFDVLGRIPVDWESDMIDNVNNMWRSLVYSYVAGLMVYLLTGPYRYWLRKRKINKGIQTRINELGVILNKMTFLFEDGDSLTPTNSISKKITKLRDGFARTDWNQINPFFGVPNIHYLVTQVKIFQHAVEDMLRMYKEYLSEEQILLLENMRSDEHFIVIKTLSETRCKIPEGAAETWGDGFCEVLKAFDKLEHDF